MKKLFLLIALLALQLPLCAQDFDRGAIRTAIQKQLSDYPESTLKDIYKNFFQDAFGPGHLMSTAENAEQGMRNYLSRETEEAKTDIDPSPAYVATGWHGRFYRVNLSVINSGQVPYETFFGAFLKSARQFVLPEIPEWAKEWAVILEEVRNLNLSFPDMEADAQAIQELLAKGEYASHHSRAYEEAYHPHYRLIEARTFEQEILPLLK